MNCDSLAEKVRAAERITPEEALSLYRNMPLAELGALAAAVRWRKHPEPIITYIVDRNINYTNICSVGCAFCAFHRPETAPDAYVLTHEQILQKVQELVNIGGVQILLQGGHHPNLPLDYYLDMLELLREKFPQVNIHGFSPAEICHLARLYRMRIEDILRRFKEAGLGSMPGGGAEILVDRVRGCLSPAKCTADEWLQVMEIAHHLGLRTTATMVLGHLETIEDRIEHLRRLRQLQDRTGGFTAFIAWTYQPQNTRLGGTEAGAHQYLRTLALARIFLDNFENIQSSWVTQGPDVGQIALLFGANDFGSLMMEENVVSAAGATFRMDEPTMQRLIRELGCQPRRRNTWYQLLN
ncbi:MAG: dehypoxanthine futalosine cyclase [Verrucomicrobiae bacterium]|nr:dehypoxanthine futalosine cyclase [Verrucomicrobiae bacterium]